MSTKVKLVPMAFVPLCPYCERELHEVAHEAKFWANRMVLACPHCRKLLGVSNTA